MLYENGRNIYPKRYQRSKKGVLKWATPYPLKILDGRLSLLGQAAPNSANYSQIRYFQRHCPLALSLGITGCGAGSSPGISEGNLTVPLTDEPGDFSDPDNPMQTINPVLVAELNIERDKPRRVRDPLKSVDIDASSGRCIWIHWQQRLSLDLSNSDKFHHLSQGGILTDLTTREGPVKIKSDSVTEGTYVITEHSIDRVVHNCFEVFSEGLKNKLDNGATTRKVHSHGEYDAGTQELVSSRIWVDLR